MTEIAEDIRKAASLIVREIEGKTRADAERVIASALTAGLEVGQTQAEAIDRKVGELIASQREKDRAVCDRLDAILARPDRFQIIGYTDIANIQQAKADADLGCFHAVQSEQYPMAVYAIIGGEP